MRILEASYYIDVRPRDVGDNKWMKTLKIVIQIYDKWLKQEDGITHFIAEHKYEHAQQILKQIALLFYIDKKTNVTDAQ